MFLLFNREENYIATLKHVLKAKHIEEINGEDTLEITTLDTKVAKDFRIAYKTEYGLWKEFIIKEVEEVRGTDGVEKKLFCESSFYETIGDYVEDKRPNGVAANIALANALESTRWEVGTVDNLGIASTSFYRTSAKESVQEVVKNWKGEIQTRVIVSGNKITHRYVDLLSQRGKDFGKRFTYTKDLESVVKTVHRDDVITALYGYGKGEEVGEGHGRRIDFSEINNSKAYVEDLEALAIWGRNNPDGSKSHVFGKVEFDDCEDLVELLQLTTDKLEELSSPLITYEAKVIDLGGADLGDTVAVIDKEFTPELRLKARVVKIVRDLLEKENNDITLGNFIPNISDFLNEQQKYIDNFRGKQGVWDRSQIIGDDGTINAQFLNNLVDELNNKMNAQGGYVYISDDGKGLTTYNKPIDQNPTSAIQLLGGAFRIANSKNPDGSFKYTTFGDGNGFVADSFVGGLLKGGKVNFDLTNGTLLIGNNVSDYSLYWDGTTLNVKGNVDIATNPTVTAIEGDISNANTELVKVKENTYTKTEVNSQFTVRDDVISSKVSSDAYLTDKDALDSKFSSVNQDIDGLEIDVGKYNDGKLSGSTYSFTGSSFDIGGKSGDTAQHTNSQSKYNHSDGSYTRISSAGLERFVSGSGQKYHYLVNVINFSQGSSGSVRWIQLPTAFKGKQFSIYLAIADSMQAPSINYGIQRFVLTPHPDYNIDYANARVPIIGYKINIELYSREQITNSVQGMLIAIY